MERWERSSVTHGIVHAGFDRQQLTGVREGPVACVVPFPRRLRGGAECIRIRYIRDLVNGEKSNVLRGAVFEGETQYVVSVKGGSDDRHNGLENRMFQRKDIPGNRGGCTSMGDPIRCRDESLVGQIRPI